MYNNIPTNTFLNNLAPTGLLTPTLIREFRTTKNLTQQEFANLLGVGLATVNRWERGDAKPSGMAEAVLYAAVAKDVLQRQAAATVAAKQSASTEIMERQEVQSSASTKVPLGCVAAAAAVSVAAAYGIYSLLKEVFEPSSDK